MLLNIDTTPLKCYPLLLLPASTVSYNNVKLCNWTTCITMVKQGAPLLFSLLVSMLVSKAFSEAAGSALQVTFSQSWEYELKKNTLLTELPYMGKEFRVGFDLLITDFGPAEWQNIIHLTIGGNKENNGDRIPACWIAPDKKLSITSSLDGNFNGGWYTHEPLLELNKWTRIEVTQTLLDGKVSRIRNFIPTKKVWSVIQVPQHLIHFYKPKFWLCSLKL